MNKKRLKNIGIYGIIFVVTTLVINLHKQEFSAIEIPWTLLVILIILEKLTDGGILKSK